MMKALTIRWFAQTIFLLAIIANPAWSQDVKSGADAFPPGTAVYLELANPGDLLDDILNHPLRDQIEKLEPVQQIFQSPQYTMAMMGKAFVEKQLGDSWDSTLREITSEGVWAGFDLETEGIVLLFKSKSEPKLKKAAETFLNLTTWNAKNEGQESPFKIRNYRSAKVADFGDFSVARIGKWFLVATKKELVNQVSDNLLDGTETNLAAADWFQQARTANRAHSNWMSVHLEPFRNAGLANEVFSGKTDNPGIELMLGGLLDALQHASHASLHFELDHHLTVNLSLPFDEQWAHESRSYFYGPEYQGRAPAILKPENTIANLTSYRDLGEWWLAKEDLFSEAVIAEMAQFDSQVSTLFAGLNFGEEVLGGLEPGAQIVVVEHHVETKNQPDIKVPAFALVARLKKDELMQRKLRVAFQTVIGFGNLNLGMEGQPQLDMVSEKIGDVRLSSTEYMIDSNAENGLLLYNFSPSIAFKGQNVVISSTRKLALDLAQQIDAGEKKGSSNTRLELDGGQLMRILELNREPLIANNMVEEGNSRQEAKTQIEALLLIGRFLKGATFDFAVHPDKMSLDLQVEFADN